MSGRKASLTTLSNESYLWAWPKKWPFVKIPHLTLGNASDRRYVCRTQLCKRICCVQGKGESGVKAFVESKGLLQISDPSQLAEIIDGVMAVNQKQLEQYRAGNKKLQGHFVG